jgi:putative selenium metabolism protein SsnA
MELLIGPGTVIPQSPSGQVLSSGGVVVDGDKIVAVGPYEELIDAYPNAELLHARGGTIMPGFINAHAHFYGMLSRGMNLKDPPPQTFQQVLERIWWRLDKALDHRGVYLSAAVGGIAALRAGCTTIIDHHASPNAIDGSLDMVAEAVDALGLRAVLCYEVTDRDGPERAKAGIAENARFAKRVAAGSERLAAKFGLHASFTVGDESMTAIREAEADLGTGFHIHCAEGPEDGAHASVHHGKKVVKRLLDHGILGPNSIVAHCVHIDEMEMGLLAETGTFVSHQPHSNMGNAVGWAPVQRMRERGIPVALGTDGYTWDMIESMRTAAVLHSHATRTPGAGVGEFAQILLQGNAALASKIFGRKIGVLEPGAAADLIVMDYFPPTPVHAGNLPWHLQFGMYGTQVGSVVVGGQVVMRDHVILGLDEAELAADAQQVALATWERF